MGIIDPTKVCGQIQPKPIEVMSKGDLHTFFNNNLAGIVKDPELKKYVSGVMVRFSDPEMLAVVYDERTDSLRLGDALSNPDRHEAYSDLVNMGDAYLWLLGFFPSYLSKAKKSGLGLQNYIEVGKTAYNYAVSVGSHVNSQEMDVGMASRISDNFGDLVRAIFELKRRIDFSVASMASEVVAEISQTLYGGKLQSAYKMPEKPMLKLV